MKARSPFANIDHLATPAFAMPVSVSPLGSGMSVRVANVDRAANAFGFVFSNAIVVATDN